MSAKFKADVSDKERADLESEGVVWSYTLCCWVDEDGDTIGPSELHDLGLCESDECDWCGALEGWEGQP